MKSYQEMLKSILNTSGWSQQRLAVKLGVSFQTVNYWLNNKVTPRPNMRNRIRNLYIARDIPYEGPVFITLQSNNISFKVGDNILLFKSLNQEDEAYELFGAKQDDFKESPLNKALLSSEKQIQVANSPDLVIKGTKPGFSIYNRIYPGAFARIMFVFNDYAIAVVEDWGIEYGG